jgi:hypothetical protein
MLRKNLSQLIPSSVDCDTGMTSVNQMDSVFIALPPTLQGRFQSAHDTIFNAFNAMWYTGIDYIPFNPQCDTILSYGQQADALTQQMQSAMGQSSVPGPSGTPQSLFQSLVGTGGTSLLIIGGLVLAYAVIKK